jgi:hypothetical protein
MRTSAALRKLAAELFTVIKSTATLAEPGTADPEELRKAATDYKSYRIGVLAGAMSIYKELLIVAGQQEELEK